jgi:hypothetical protein
MKQVLAIGQKYNFLRQSDKVNIRGIESGRQLLPPMRWRNFSKATDEEFKGDIPLFKINQTDKKCGA